MIMKEKKVNKNGISVVIPTFNRAQYLYATLICLCNQKVAEGYVVARVAAELFFIGHDNAAIKDAWAKSVLGYRN